MATNSQKFTLMTIFIFAMALSSILPCDAARDLVAVNKVICIQCVCCTPPPPGTCCSKCCASSSPPQIESIGQSP
ncbi:hypothetical protein RYX36_028614 [Vicia faba]